MIAHDAGLLYIVSLLLSGILEVCEGGRPQPLTPIRKVGAIVGCLALACGLYLAVNAL